MNKALLQLAHELRTQDNLATAYPLYCVQQRRRIWGMDPDYCNDYEWHTEDHEYRYTNSEIQAVIQEEVELKHGPPVYDVDEVSGKRERNPEEYGFERVYYYDYWYFVCAHLTMKAANKYIEDNCHNLTEPRVYVTSQHRCPEWQEAVKHLSELEEPFEPNWASAPGETISDLMDKGEIVPGLMCKHLGMSSSDELKWLLDGRLAITPELAEKLEDAFGTPARFWLNREANYRKSLVRIYKKES